MRLPSCETSISPTLVVWSLLIGSGSTSGCASAFSDVRRQITARSWSARCNVKKYWPPHARGTLIRSERIRLSRRVRMAGNDGRWASSDWVYLFWASIQARVSGLCWSSSQRYGSTMSTPWRVSWTLSVRVEGGAGTFCAASLALAAGAATAVASARPSKQIRVSVMEETLVVNVAARADDRLTRLAPLRSGEACMSWPRLEPNPARELPPASAPGGRRLGGTEPSRRHLDPEARHGPLPFAHDPGSIPPTRRP